MTFPGSRETRAARENLAAARDAEAAHRRECIDCIRAAHRRKPADRCDPGRELAAAVRAAEAAWRAGQEADRQPAPGQGALF